MRVSEIVTNTLLVLSVRQRSVFQGIAIPSLIIVLSDIGTPEQLGEGLQLVVGFITTIVGLLAFVYLAIIVHRCVLIGGDSIPPWGVGAWSERETTFLLRSLGIVFIAIVPWLLISSWIVPRDLNIPGKLRLLPAFYLVARFSLVFPSIAVNKKLSFGDSWRLTKKHHLLVFLLVGIMPLLINLPADFLPATLFGTISKSIFGCVTTVITVALLSKTYEICIDRDRTAHR